jgi:hypothetical protein
MEHGAWRSLPPYPKLAIQETGSKNQGRHVERSNVYYTGACPYKGYRIADCEMRIAELKRLGISIFRNSPSAFRNLFFSPSALRLSHFSWCLPKIMGRHGGLPLQNDPMNMVRNDNIRQTHVVAQQFRNPNSRSPSSIHPLRSAKDKGYSSQGGNSRDRVPPFGLGFTSHEALWQKDFRPSFFRRTSPWPP